MRPAWLPSARRGAVLALAAFTLLLVGLSRYTVPTGLAAPVPIPPIAGLYTTQISGFIDVPPGHRVGLAAYGHARLVLDGALVARVEAPGLVWSELTVASGVHRALIQFEPIADRENPAVFFGPPGAASFAAPRAALSPRRLPPAAWILRRNIEWLGLGVALAWMMAGAAFGLTRARIWFVRHLPADPMARRATWGMLAFSLLIFAFPFWWGVPVGWSQDEVWPVDLRGLAETLTPGWSSRYPPLHIYLIAIVNSPLLAGMGLDLLDPASPLVFSIMKGVTHLVSVAMAVGITVLVYVCGTHAAGYRAGILAGLFWTLTLPAVFYAKTANLDIPYTFWFALALRLYVRALDAGSVRLYVAFAAAGTLAIVTKDQAYGLFALPALHLAYARARRLGGPLAGLPALARDRAILLAIVTGVLLFAAAHNLPFNWTGFRDHVDTITGGASEDYRMVDGASPAGHAWLLVRTVEQVAWAHTWPGALLAGIGIILAVRSPAGRRRLLPFLLPAVSYYLTFIAVVGYAYDRFMIPIGVVLAVLAGVALDRLWPAGGPRWRTVAVAALLAFMTLRTGSINLLMAADSRYEVRHWMRQQIPADTRIAVIENWELLPNLEDFSPFFLQYPVDYLDDFRPPVVVVSDNYRRRYLPGERHAEWYEALVSGRAGYRVVLRHRADVPLAILARERQFRDPDPSFSALHKVNPEITVLFRDDWEP